jgi:hypothetical protein
MRCANATCAVNADRAAEPTASLRACLRTLLFVFCIGCDEAGIASCRPGAGDNRRPKYHCCRFDNEEGGVAKLLPWLLVHCTLCVCAACRKTAATADGWLLLSICCLSSRSEALEREACKEAARHDLRHPARAVADLSLNGCEEASSRDDCAGSSPGEVERDGSRRSAVGHSVLKSPWVSTRAERADVRGSRRRGKIARSAHLCLIWPKPRRDSPRS